MISGVFLLMFVSTAAAQRGLSVDCSGGDWVTVRWRPVLDFSQKVDPSKALLGNCPPSIMVSEDTLLFYASLRDCGFIRQVTASGETYSNTLIYDQRPELPLVSQSLQCVYDLPALKATTSGAVEEDDDTGEQETFIMEITDPDFSAPAPSLSFRLGSMIPVRAAVELQSHGPLRIYVESCMAATDADISRAARVRPIISNSGCLMESKMGNSSFLPRRRPDELRLYLEAFEFAVGQNVFLHCDLKAWDVRSVSVDQKACHYVWQQHRWELLDDPSQSYACTCCDSTCFWRPGAADGVSARKVLGPFVIMEDEPRSDTRPSGEQAGPSGSPVWLVVIAVAGALVTVTGVLALSHYLCFWRGGRMGYRPSRDLLTKY